MATPTRFSDKPTLRSQQRPTRANGEAIRQRQEIERRFQQQEERNEDLRRREYAAREENREMHYQNLKAGIDAYNSADANVVAKGRQFNAAVETYRGSSAKDKSSIATDIQRRADEYNAAEDSRARAAEDVNRLLSVAKRTGAVADDEPLFTYTPREKLSVVFQEVPADEPAPASEKPTAESAPDIKRPAKYDAVYSGPSASLGEPAPAGVTLMNPEDVNGGKPLRGTGEDVEYLAPAGVTLMKPEDVNGGKPLRGTGEDVEYLAPSLTSEQIELVQKNPDAAAKGIILSTLFGKATDTLVGVNAGVSGAVGLIQAPPEEEGKRESDISKSINEGIFSIGEKLSSTGNPLLSVYGGSYQFFGKDWEKARKYTEDGGIPGGNFDPGISYSVLTSLVSLGGGVGTVKTGLVAGGLALPKFAGRGAAETFLSAGGKKVTSGAGGFAVENAEANILKIGKTAASVIGGGGITMVNDETKASTANKAPEISASEMNAPADGYEYIYQYHKSGRGAVRYDKNGNVINPDKNSGKTGNSDTLNRIFSGSLFTGRNTAGSNQNSDKTVNADPVSRVFAGNLFTGANLTAGRYNLLDTPAETPTGNNYRKIFSGLNYDLPGRVKDSDETRNPNQFSDITRIRDEESNRLDTVFDFSFRTNTRTGRRPKRLPDIPDFMEDKQPVKRKKKTSKKAKGRRVTNYVPGLKDLLGGSSKASGGRKKKAGDDLFAVKKSKGGMDDLFRDTKRKRK